MAKPFIAIILAFWVVAIIGFTPTYFLRLGEVSKTAHLHGVLLFAWYGLLLVQAGLIQAAQRKSHRALGRLSFIVAPALVLASLIATHAMMNREATESVNGSLQASPYHLYLFAIIIPTLFGFAYLYIQAIRHRANWNVHARYMVATGMVLLTPALVRLLAVFVLPNFVTFSSPPTLDQLTLPENLSLPLLQLLALGLMISDWRSGRDARPYAECLLTLVAIQALFNLLPGLDWWDKIARAFVGLPLS